jgi:PAS domain S-box-containing protein
LEQSREGIVVLDQNGKVYEANKRYADMLGYSMEKIHNLHVWDWDTQFTKEQLIEMIRSVDDAGAYFETRQRRKDGAIIDVETSNNGAVYREQKLEFCVCRNITDRKRAEMERKNLIIELKDALAQVKTLSGLLPICSHCKKNVMPRGTGIRSNHMLINIPMLNSAMGFARNVLKNIYGMIETIDTGSTTAAFFQGNSVLFGNNEFGPT